MELKVRQKKKVIKCIIINHHKYWIKMNNLRSKGIIKVWLMYH